MTNTMEMEVTTATQVFPSDGKGGATAAYGTDKVTTAGEVFTATTGGGAGATWTNDPSAGTAPSVGDYVATSDGCWGALVSCTSTTVTVDKWRCQGANGTSGGPAVVPAAGSHIRIYQGKCILMGARRSRVVRLSFTKSTATNTVKITDSYGVALMTHTIGMTNEPPLDLTDGGGGGGFIVEGPFGIISSNTATACTVVFSQE